jgi:hypothetical protein
VDVDDVEVDGDGVVEFTSIDVEGRAEIVVEGVDESASPTDAPPQPVTPPRRSATGTRARPLRCGANVLNAT